MFISFYRSVFSKCLPHTQTIASWYRVIDGQPGFTVESLDALTELQKQTPYQIVVSLVLDGMAVRKHLQRMGNKIVGYTNCGGVLPEVDAQHSLAKEALIFIVVGINVPFKVQVGYFMINSLTGKQLAYLTGDELQIDRLLPDTRWTEVAIFNGSVARM